jgi:pyrroline-5-carboxylate reductase
MKVGIVGSGGMAEAVIGGLLRHGDVEPAAICASGPRSERGDGLAARYGIRTAVENREALRGADVVVLSVKPQVMRHVMEEVRDAMEPGAFAFSIAAGISMATIAGGLGRKAVVRAMPNSPAQVGHGITVWTHTPEVSEPQLEQAAVILRSLGEAVQVADESYLDMATALSGTGPAYVFLFLEALVDAGVHLGFSRHLAEKLVVKTLAGALEFYEQQPNHLSRLRNQVTSPGGTAAEALYFLERARFRSSISRAVWAAYQRSLALGRDAEDLHA